MGGFYGQEINLTTYNLARINVFLHDVNFENLDIAHCDTLTAGFGFSLRLPLRTFVDLNVRHYG